MNIDIAAAVIVAWTLYHEGRSEGASGLALIASVVHNEAQGVHSEIPRLVQNARRYHCWKRLGDAYEYARDHKPPAIGPDGKAWVECQTIAWLLLSGKFQPITKATHYCKKGEAPLAWKTSKRMTYLYTSGGHEFWVDGANAKTQI